MLKKQNIFIYATLFFLFVATLIVASFVDLSFSNAIVIKNGNFFTLLFEIIGKAPAYIILGICLLLLSKSVRANKNKKTLFLFIIYLFLSFASFFLLIFEITDPIVSNTLIRLVLSIGVGGTIFCVLAVLFNRMSFEKAKTYEKWAVFAGITIVALLLVTLALKFVWGRVRFVDLNLEQTNFTKWFVINEFNGGSSFPSGHVALALTLFLFLYSPFFKNAKLSTKIIFLFLCFAFVALCFFSRILAGHHFLSDVTVSVLIFLVLSFFSSWLFFGLENNRTEFTKKNFFTSLFDFGNFSKKDDILPSTNQENFK